MRKIRLILALFVPALLAAQGAVLAVAQPNATSVAATSADTARPDQLQNLSNSLATAPDADTSLAIAEKIQVLWLATDSSTAELLMRRALLAIHTQNLDVALNVLDKLVDLSPDWAEAWNKRATVRYLLDDEQGSLDDIERVLKLEPRHFGALNGAAMIYEQQSNKAEALKAYRQVLSLAPQWPQVKAHVDKLAIEVEGQGI